METTEQTPEYIWHEPTTSWKTQEQIAQYELEQQQEIERQAQEELQRQQEELQRQYDELHKTFVYFGEDGIIQRAFIASSEYASTKPCGDGVYIEYTSDIKGSPIFGHFYNQELNAFIPPKPYESWILNEETLQWESPVPRPTT
jgi:hypothetical protein